MKYFPIFALVIASMLAGCKHNEFDVSADQIAKKSQAGGGMPGPMPDPNHLPPGAVKHEFKKGDVLPDGSIDDGKHKFFRIELPDNAAVPGAHTGPGAPQIQRFDTKNKPPEGAH